MSMLKQVVKSEDPEAVDGIQTNWWWGYTTQVNTVEPLEWGNTFY